MFLLTSQLAAMFFADVSAGRHVFADVTAGRHVFADVTAGRHVFVDVTCWPTYVTSRVAHT